MKTFDEILPTIAEVFREMAEDVERLGPVVINRDLNGRVRLILEERARGDGEAGPCGRLSERLADILAPHAFEAEDMVLFEPSLEVVTRGAPSFPLEGFAGVTVVDRLATEGDWSSIAEVSPGAPRLVFFSVKGGVGRSTALAVAAWSLARSGRRVLVLDLDLEAPGLSSALLPAERRPAFGIVDWLAEDLVGNGEPLIGAMTAKSDLCRDGDILVVPAHGRDPGEYPAKLGRAWMGRIAADGSREPWAERLKGLIGALERQCRPDVILVDSRAGIDEVASACVSGLGAKAVLLFAFDSDQTWEGYGILFRHWNRTGVARAIRERLHLVGAMIPETDGARYVAGLRQRAWNLFTETLYDEVPPGEFAGDLFSFDESDETAPHFLWPIRWHRGFAALQSLHERFAAVDGDEVRALFGPFLEGVESCVAEEDSRR